MRFATAVEDSDRWGVVAVRDSDIVISTPPKCGTTWMQGIVSSLLWPRGDAPGTLGERSPWIDARFSPLHEMSERVETMAHRRFLKTHSPAHALPLRDEVRYVLVYRRSSDAVASWGNHRRSFTPEFTASINELSAGDDVCPLIEGWHGDWHELYEEWLATCNPFTHLSSWWPRRGQDNVMFVHYSDLSRDLDQEMRRVAAFLDIDVAESDWPSVVKRCTLGAMREQARCDLGDRPSTLTDGVDSFFFRGGIGRGREVLPPDLLDDLAALGERELPTDARRWLETT